MTRPTLTVGLANYGSLFAPAEWYRFVDLAPRRRRRGRRPHRRRRPRRDGSAHRELRVGQVPGSARGAVVRAAHRARRDRVGDVARAARDRHPDRAVAARRCCSPSRPRRSTCSRGGRLDLGVGTGWQREEYDAEGIDFAQRGQLLSDTLAACKVLWRDTPAALDTPTLSFHDIYCEPKPLQAGGVPLWIAGTLHAPQSRAARAVGRRVDPDHGRDARRHRRRRAAHRRRVARPRAAIPRRCRCRRRCAWRAGDDGRPDLARSMASVPDLVAAGATDVHVTLRAFSTRSGRRARRRSPRSSAGSPTRWHERARALPSRSC